MAQKPSIPKGTRDFSPMEMETIVAPKLFSKSLMGMIWHMLILPFYTLKKKYDVIIILAASRRYLAFSRIPQIGIIHDLSPIIILAYKIKAVNWKEKNFSYKVTKIT